MKNIFQSKTFTYILYGIGICIIALAIFQAGISIGYRKAEFSFRGGDNYYRAFRGPRERSFMGMMQPDEFVASHGAVGKIIKIDLPTFIIEGPDGIEKTVHVNNQTNIRRFRDTIKVSDLTLNDHVVVIGSPDDKTQIEARLIRIVPPPPDTYTTSTEPLVN